MSNGSPNMYKLDLGIINFWLLFYCEAKDQELNICSAKYIHNNIHNYGLDNVVKTFGG